MTLDNAKNYKSSELNYIVDAKNFEETIAIGRACRAIDILQTELKAKESELAHYKETLVKAHDHIYNTMPYPANTPEYERTLEILRVIEDAIGGSQNV
ncbi:MAG: hypothetical protein PHS93_08875 [Candidatus Omnitrophica bacterium]|nr:hypothetical protein [Candidatus Omnitrophota bacterium]